MKTFQNFSKYILTLRGIIFEITKDLLIFIAKLAIVRGNVNKNFPASMNKTANIINPINNKTLRLLEIFFDAVLAKSLKIKYKQTKISTV